MRGPRGRQDSMVTSWHRSDANAENMHQSCTAAVQKVASSRIASGASSVYEMLIDTLYPRRCPVCDEVLPWGGGSTLQGGRSTSWGGGSMSRNGGSIPRDDGAMPWDGGSIPRDDGAMPWSDDSSASVSESDMGTCMQSGAPQVAGGFSTGSDDIERWSNAARMVRGLICPGCFEKLSFVTEPTCAKCGKQLLLASQELCADCKEHPKSFERGVAALNYEEHAQESMIKIKYGKRREYARFYGRMLAGYLGERIREMNPQCIIPVPVHPERFIERGYNQAELLAGELSRCLKIPMEKGILVRVRKTAVQKDLGPEERLKNLSEAFGVMYDADAVNAGADDAVCAGADDEMCAGADDADESRMGRKCAAQSRVEQTTWETSPESVQGGEADSRLLPYDRVMLVDDIYTTGSTIEACTRVLKAAGVQEVYFVTVCTGSDR